jgi:hypothetical protein
MSMDRYWDLETKEKAALTTEQIERFLQIDMMENGIEPAIKPDLRPVPEAPNPSVTMFECGGIYFETAALAREFASLKPYRSDYDYKIGYEFTTTKPLKTSINEVYFYSDSQLMQCREALLEAKGAREHNAAENNRYEKQTENISLASEHLYADYYEACAKIRKAEKIVGMYNEYKDLAGDAWKGFVFLQKTYDQSEVIDAFKLTDTAIPVDPATEPMPA